MIPWDAQLNSNRYVTFSSLYQQHFSTPQRLPFYSWNFVRFCFFLFLQNEIFFVSRGFAKIQIAQRQMPQLRHCNRFHHLQRQFRSAIHCSVDIRDRLIPRPYTLSMIYSVNFIHSLVSDFPGEKCSLEGDHNFSTLSGDSWTAADDVIERGMFHIYIYFYVAAFQAKNWSSGGNHRFKQNLFSLLERGQSPPSRLLETYFYEKYVSWISSDFYHCFFHLKNIPSFYFVSWHRR